MKILVLTNLYPPHYEGGYELHCETVVNALKARGHCIKVLTSDHRRDASKQPEGDVTRELKVHGLFGHPWLGIRKLARQEQHNNDRLREAVQKFSPDLIYVWNLSGLSKSMLFTVARTRIPYVVAVCDHWIARADKADVWLRWWNQEKTSVSNRLLRLGWTVNGQRRRFDEIAPTQPAKTLRFPRIYFCSAALREFTAGFGYDVKHGAVIYCPLDVTRFHSEPKPENVPMEKLLYVGRLNADKGVMTALKAMALLRDKFPGCLSIYGRGEPEFEQEMKAYVEQHKLPVRFHAPLSPEEMPGVYSQHDALLFTSEWPEPFALTPLEAMASGVPVIGTTTGGSKELFRDRENALTYTAGNPAELAQRVLELNADNTLRARIARKGYAEVRRRFAEPIIIDQVEAYLQDTLACWAKFSRQGTGI